MSDIFLSYAIEDRDKAAALADVFLQKGWSAWRPQSKYVRWGRYDKQLVLSKLEGAKVVVMLWSRAAHGSDFVRETLKRAENSRLIFVLLEKVKLPSGLVSPRDFDLSGWNGEASHAVLTKLLRHVHTRIGAAPPASKPPASIEKLSLSEIQESARRGIKESAQARPKEDARFGGVFISYRRSEAAAYAGRLYDRLAARFGRERVFLDTENIGWGEDFVEAVTSAAESCSVMIALVSRGWARDAGGQPDLDDYVRLEVAKALGRKIRVIPILIQGASMPAPKDLPEDLSPLARRNALVLSDDARWERDVKDLMTTLESLLKD